MGPLVKYGTFLAPFATTFYFSYSGAEVQKMTLGQLFDNPVSYDVNESSSGIDQNTLNKFSCMISNGTKQKSLCSTTEDGANTAGKSDYKPNIHKYSWMKLYPEVNQIFNSSWDENQNNDQQTFEPKTLMPKLIEWCNKKRREYVTVLDQRLLWHMTVFCSHEQKLFKKSDIPT